jgi:hypothetical protein
MTCVEVELSSTSSVLTIVAVRDELRCAAAVLLARWRARGSCPTTCLHLNSSLGPDPIPQCPTCSGSMSRRRRRRASNRETRAGGLHSGGEWAPPWVTNYTAASDAGSGNIYSALHGPCKLTQQRRRSAAEGASEGSEFRVKYNSKPLSWPCKPCLASIAGRRRGWAGGDVGSTK